MENKSSMLITVAQETRVGYKFISFNYLDFWA
jgi:hypothetical protein